MENSIDIPVVYKGEPHHFTARILTYGYVYKLAVLVNDTEVLFEPDEQGGYRAVLANPEADMKKADKGLIAAIAEMLGEMREEG